MCEGINEDFPTSGISVCFADSNDGSPFWLFSFHLFSNLNLIHDDEISSQSLFISRNTEFCKSVVVVRFFSVSLCYPF